MKVNTAHSRSKAEDKAAVDRTAAAAITEGQNTEIVTDPDGSKFIVTRHPNGMSIRTRIA